MRHYEALTEFDHTKSDCPISVFLAGGITGCPNWQWEMGCKLEDEKVSLLNPRRKDFPINDPTASQKQIEWEFNHLRKADSILFWFPCETLCPIVLYELGAWSAKNKKIFVGCHPDYKRKQDVVIQTQLARPEVPVVFTLFDLAEQVKKWLRG